MIIAIWTKNPAKLNAISSGIDTCVYLNMEDIELISESVESGVSDMPKSLEENITWAKNRAENLRKKWINADLYIWMEGWTTIIWETAYLFWIIYIINRKWEWHLWVSPMMEVPKLVKTIPNLLV